MQAPPNRSNSPFRAAETTIHNWGRFTFILSFNIDINRYKFTISRLFDIAIHFFIYFEHTNGHAACIHGRRAVQGLHLILTNKLQRTEISRLCVKWGWRTYATAPVRDIYLCIYRHLPFWFRCLDLALRRVWHLCELILPLFKLISIARYVLKSLLK